MSRFISACAVTSALMLALACPMFAQVNASVDGSVADSSGALIPKASVTATNTATGIVSNAQTNDSGAYSFPSLQPGSYTVAATNTGFQTETYRDVALGGGSRSD